MPFLLRLTTLVLLGFCTAAVAAEAAQRPGDIARPTLTATRLTAGEAVTVDGLLDEPVWRRATTTAPLTQSDPRNGEPATERTEIRVVFDRDHLYIGARLFDSAPDSLLGNQMVRDGSLSADDRFIWVLDPFYDQRSGYYFEVNPAGAMGDAQLVAASGSTSGMAQNRAWDGIWVARVRRDREGWTVEVDIPFRTLSFSPDQQAWGANFQRTVRRKNEESFWSGWDRNQGLYNLNAAGRIEGLSQVSQGRGLDVKPYAIGNVRQTGSPGDAVYSGATGLDVQYSVTPQLRANLTVNTDFAQTEVDDRQVNLTRFPLFFPEKRDFFLEGAGNFDFSREANNDLTAFFTRRIGIDERTGRPQRILYGAKLGGRAGHFSIGGMQVRTGDEGGAPGEDFSVFRPKRQFFSQSYVGGVYTRRAIHDSSAPARQTVGADMQLATSRFRGNQNLLFAAHYIRTPDGTGRGDDAAWGVRLNYPNDRWRLQIASRGFQKNFAPAIGFAERVDYRKYYGVLRFGPRPRQSRWLRQISMQFFPELFTDTAGRWIERNYQFTFAELDFQSGDSATFRVVPTYNRLQRDFRIGGGLTLPAGAEYTFTRYTATFTAANQRVISGNTSISGGSFYSGRRLDLSATLNVRPRRGVLAALTGSVNNVDLAEGHFSTRLLRAVVNTQLNPFVSISNNVQYDSVSRLLGWQFRFRWIVSPGKDLYLVWLDNWLDTGDHLATLDRSGALKAVYTLSF